MTIYSTLLLCYNKYHCQSQLGMELVHLAGSNLSPRQELKTGVNAEAMKLLTDLLLLASSTCFLISPRTTKVE